MFSGWVPWLIILQSRTSNHLLISVKSLAMFSFWLFGGFSYWNSWENWSTTKCKWSCHFQIKTSENLFKILHQEILELDACQFFSNKKLSFLIYINNSIRFLFCHDEGSGLQELSTQQVPKYMTIFFIFFSISPSMFFQLVHKTFQNQAIKDIFDNARYSFI